MERIKELLAKLENKVSPSLVKRLNSLNELSARVAKAKEEFDADPTDENKEAFEQIEDYFADMQEDLADDLEDYLNERTAQKEAPTKAPEKAEQVHEAEPIEKEEGSGLFGLIFGGLLLVGSLGAINYFRNNK
jgi:DNA-binding protein H-NS